MCLCVLNDASNIYLINKESYFLCLLSANIFSYILACDSEIGVSNPSIFPDSAFTASSDDG